MAIIPEAAQELFKKVPDVIFSTANEQGQPNSCIVGMKARKASYAFRAGVVDCDAVLRVLRAKSPGK